MSDDPHSPAGDLIRRMWRLLGAQVADLERARGLPPLAHPRSTAARRRRKRGRAQTCPAQSPPL